MARRRGFGTIAAGHALSAVGLRSVGSVVRSAGYLSIGAQSEEGAAGIASLTSAMAPAIAALGGIVVAAKLVSVGFEALSKTATEMVGAIAQIGGARGLQSMFVEAATSERLASGISANASDVISKKDVLSTINKLSSASEFSPEEVAGMFRSFIGKRGNASEFQQLGSFATDLASVSGLSPEQTGTLLGQLRAQFPGMSMSQTQSAARNLWGLGKSGAVELKDATSVSQALGFAKFVSPDLGAGLNFEMGATQLAQVYKGKNTAEQSVTSVRRLQEELINSATGKKHGEFGQVLGQDYLTHSDTGQLVLRNAPESFAKLALGAYEGKLPEKLVESRAQGALRGFVQGQAESQFTPGMSEAGKLDIVEKLFKKFEDAEVTIDEFDNAVKDVKDTTDYQLKQTFNDLSIQLEGGLLPILKELVPVVKQFALSIIDHKDDIGEFLTHFVAWLQSAVEVLPVFGKLIGDIAVTIGNAIEWILTHWIGVPHSAKEAQDENSADTRTRDRDQKDLDTMKASGKFGPEDLAAQQAVVDADNKALATAKEYLQTYQDIAAAKAKAAGFDASVKAKEHVLSVADEYQSKSDAFDKRWDDKTYQHQKNDQLVPHIVDLKELHKSQADSVKKQVDLLTSVVRNTTPKLKTPE